MRMCMSHFNVLPRDSSGGSKLGKAVLPLALFQILHGCQIWPGNFLTRLEPLWLLGQIRASRATRGWPGALMSSIPPVSAQRSLLGRCMECRWVVSRHTWGGHALHSRGCLAAIL